MPDIEERLRAGLTALADDVPPSDEPKAALARRLATRRRILRRAPALTAAAAAAVVTAVFVPIVVNQDAPSGDVPAGAANAPARSELPTLGTLFRDGKNVRAVGHLDGDTYCTGLEQPATTVRLTCEELPAWPERPANSVVQSRELLNGDATDDTGMLAQRLVFLTDPRVATLAVRRGNGTAVRVTELDRNEHAVLFLADFAGSPDGFGYTARDGGGKVLEEAIT